MKAKKAGESISKVQFKEIIEREGQYILMNRFAFRNWLKRVDVKREIKLIQNHHTWRPGYAEFHDDNHFKMCQGMKRSHLKRGFSDIAQNITTFPDGMIAICRPLKTAPAGIKGANRYGICIEHIGNFDIDGDQMSKEHRKTILWINSELCKHFGLMPSVDTVVYHHWWTASGKRTNGVNAAKSCPGTNFFGGNKVEDAEQIFIPAILKQI